MVSRGSHRIHLIAACIPYLRRQRNNQNIWRNLSACIIVVRPHRPPHLLSGGHLLAVFSGCSHPRPDNDITGFSDQDPRPHRWNAEETAAALAPFLPSLARLHGLESLNLSGAHTGAFARSLRFAAEAPNFCRVVYHACSGCDLPCWLGLSFLNALPGAFKLVDLHYDAYISPTRFEDLRFRKQHEDNVLELPQAIITECSRGRSWLSVLRHNQHAHFCHRLLYWNFRLQCIVTHAPPPLRLSSPSASLPCGSKRFRLKCSLINYISASSSAVSIGARAVVVEAAQK